MAQYFSLSDLGLVSSTTQLLTQWLATMQSEYPGYAPSAGNQEYIQAQIFAAQAAALAQLCSEGGDELFRQFGLKLLQVPYQVGTPAMGVVSVTAVDTAGYTLPAGTQLTLTLNGVPVGFATAADLTIAPGNVSGQVLVLAVQTGVAFNSAGGTPQLVNPVTWVSGVTLVSNASGGVDPEDDDHYRARLVSTAQLLKPSIVTAANFAAMALNFTPAPGTDQQLVGRAAAIDGYNPTANTYNNQRYTTTCVTDAFGQPLNSDTLAAISAWFQTLREVGFVCPVVNANYTTVYVAASVHPAAGFTGASVQAAVQSALINYLNPAVFGLPPSSSTGWTNTQYVYRSRVEAIIQNAFGVDHIVPGTLAIDVNPTPTNTSADLPLPGPFPLPNSSTSSIPLSNITIV